MASARSGEIAWVNDQRRLEEFGLALNGLRSLTPDQASALAGYQGGTLSLAGLASLDVAQARALAAWRGPSLDLSGLTALGAETASALARSKTGELVLGGLASLSSAEAAGLADYRGGALLLPGLRSLSAEAGSELGRFKGRLVVGLEAVDDSLAAGLLGQGASVEFTQLRDLSEEAARAWRDSRCFSEAPGLRRVSPEAGAVFAGHDGRLLQLDDLEELDAATAAALCRYEHSLSLEGLTTLDVETAATLGACAASDLDLSGVVSLSPEAALALTRFYAGDLALSSRHQYSDETIEVLRIAPGELSFR